MRIDSNNIKRYTIDFISGENTIYGMIHSPETDKFNSTGILLLSAGLKNRTGYAKIYVKLADYLASKGYHVMRFDYHGCGDSDGKLSLTGAYQELHADINGFIQTGLFAQDALKAMDVLKREAGCRKFVLSGLCGGSNTAVYTAVQSEEVESVILLNLPVALDSELAREKQKGSMDIFKVQFLYEAYMKKIFSPKAWIRFLGLKSDYKSILQMFKTKLKQAPKTESNDNDSTAMVDNFSFNKDLLGTLDKYFSSGRKAYLFFSENDQLRAEYEKYFEALYGKELLGKYSGQYVKTVIQNSNHSFTHPEWREELFTSFLKCLDDNSS
ncbi:MAG: hypothetical protein GY855_13590 [candidate division Zixibacteria bacterium]|nr:hypothetical protein [candidate division Zixibacteria bacterium]